MVCVHSHRPALVCVRSGAARAAASQASQGGRRARRGLPRRLHRQRRDQHRAALARAARAHLLQHAVVLHLQGNVTWLVAVIRDTFLRW